ncbi:MAG TPA: DUF4339 domain-containing protein [Thermoanaerobaculia bacterium]|nr:DUF4339 domain-containing protein [Thermoanaerobaculia bacterium]
MGEIFIGRNGQRYGPYTREAINAFVTQGSVSIDDDAWIQGISQWVKLQVLLRNLDSEHTEPQLAIKESCNDQSTTSDPAASKSILTPNSVGIGESDSRVSSAGDLQGLNLGTLQEVNPSGARKRKGWGKAIALTLAVSIVIVLAAVFSQLFSPYVFLGSDLRPHPEAGYVWLSPESHLDWRVRWFPGMIHPLYANVFARSEPNVWAPSPGYVWMKPGKISPVVWVPGKSEPGFPHVTAGRDEGTWARDPGYSWHASANAANPRTIWESGLPHSDAYPHITSGTQQDTWVPDPGYSWANDAWGGNPKVMWTPGQEHREHSHVVASQNEGRWSPAPGYQFVDLENENDWRVMRPDWTSKAWNAMSRIDQTLDPRRCARPPSKSVILNAIREARDQYRSLDLEAVHPALQDHINACVAHFSEVYGRGETCSGLEDARESGFSLSDAAITAACLLADNFTECYNKAKGLGVIGDEGEKIVCANLIENERLRLDTLIEEREQLRGYLTSKYGLRLTATEPLLCP